MRPCVLVCVWDRVYSGRTTFTPPPRSITMLPSVPLLLHTHMHTGPNARLGCVCEFYSCPTLKERMPAATAKVQRETAATVQTHTHTHTTPRSRQHTLQEKRGWIMDAHAVTLWICKFVGVWRAAKCVCVCASVCVLMLCVGCSYASVSHLTSLDISFHMRGNRQIRFQSITNRAGLPHNHTQ